MAFPHFCHTLLVTQINSGVRCVVGEGFYTRASISGGKEHFRPIWRLTNTNTLTIASKDIKHFWINLTKYVLNLYTEMTK